MSEVPGSMETDEIRQQVIDMTRQGMSANEIGLAIGRSTRQINRIRHDTGIAKPRPALIPEAVFIKAKTMLDDGCSYAEVARTFGVHNKTIANRLPGYTWTQAQVSEHAVFCRRNAGILK